MDDLLVFHKKKISQSLLSLASIGDRTHRSSLAAFFLRISKGAMAWNLGHTKVWPTKALWKAAGNQPHIAQFQQAAKSKEERKALSKIRNKIYYQSLWSVQDQSPFLQSCSWQGMWCSRHPVAQRIGGQGKPLLEGQWTLSHWLPGPGPVIFDNPYLWKNHQKDHPVGGTSMR